MKNVIVFALDQQLVHHRCVVLGDQVARTAIAHTPPIQNEEQHAALLLRQPSRDEALAEFRSLSGFADVLASLQENPLPDLILVTPAAGLDESQVAALRCTVACPSPTMPWFVSIFR